MLPSGEGLKELGVLSLKKSSKHKLRMTIVGKRAVRGKTEAVSFVQPIRPQNNGGTLQGADYTAV